jgi:amino acid adenylation domain-containing protein
MKRVDQDEPVSVVSRGPVMEKRELLAKLLEKRAARGQHPLSFAQQRLWFLDQLQPGTSVYNISSFLALEEPFDPVVFAACLEEITRRQQSLRTTFPSIDGKPLQQIAERADIAVQVVDFRNISLAAINAEMRQRARDFLNQPFDLASGPLLRCAVMRYRNASFLAVSMHHIISDGWSIGVFSNELRALYEAFATGRPSPLPELPIQYTDFARWQRQWLRDEVLERQLAYWRKHLRGPAILDLPTDRPRPAIQTTRGAGLALSFPTEIRERLSSLCQREGTTLFMVLLAVFQILLHRYTGQEEVPVGVPVAGRNRRELEALIGFFVNTLVMRGDLRGGPTCSALLARTRDAALGGFAHQDIPFEKLVDDLQPERDTSRTPLFQAAFVFQNTPNLAPEQHRLALGISELRDTAKFDLTLDMGEDSDGLLGAIEYNRDLFDHTTMQRLGEHFQSLLVAFCEGAETPVGELPMLDEAQRHQLLTEWIPHHRSVSPVRRTIHGWFAEQARRRPQAVAAVCEGDALTYQELERRANGLARHLRRLGVGPEARVAICLERSIETVVSTLAVLKAGGAYVPIDPLYPRERKGYLLSDSSAAVLLTTRGMLPELPAPDGVRTVLLDPDGEDRAAIDSEPDEEICPATSPDSAAYVIYTSGSTGKPKGVLVRHDNVVRLFTSTAPWFDFGPEDSWTFFHSYAFDFSVWEIWGALLHGGRLVVVPYWVSRSPEEFHDLLARERVTVLNQTPSAFRQLIAADRTRGGDLALRLVIFGGEALDPQSLRPWIESHGDERPRLVNMYGITETTVHVTYRPVTAQDLAVPGSPIGNAIPDLSVHLLDRALLPVPIGVPGELCVGGAGLARGYLNRPELTAERFVPTPYGGVPGARIYRSGDLARYRPNGDLEHLGRMDHQVKVRGFRIELGEVETVLAAHPGVREAVAVVREDEAGDRILVAYVVPVGPEVTAAALRDYVRERQPDPMVPSKFVLLDQLPLTEHGKVNRRALPKPEQTATAGDGAVPSTPAEAVLAEIWADLLKLERVGVEDNFFALGGDSIKAVRLVSRANERLGGGIKIQDVFTHQTIRDLAAAQRGAATGERGAALARHPRPEHLPLSFAQERLWFLDQIQPGSPVYNIPLALGLRGNLSWPVLAASLCAVAARHEALRTIFVQIGGRPVQVISPSLDLAPPVVDLAALPAGHRDGEASRLSAREATRPYDLAQGPLVRATLLRLAADHHIALFCMHHIVSDGWSMGVLVREVGALYAALARGTRPDLPDLKVQYADFALWQRERLSGGVLEGQIDYWRKRLAGAPAVLELPFDRPRPPVQRFHGAQLGAFLGPEVLHGLAGLQRAHQATLFMVLLACFQALLSRVSGQDDLVIGSPVAGRSRMETEDLIGFFVNTVVLRAELGGDPAFSSVLAQARETAVGAYGHEDLPFERLVEVLQPERSLAHSPIYQVVLALQNAPMEALELPGLTLEPAPAQTGSTKFDLTVALTETPQGLSATWEYSTDLFDEPTIGRLQGYFEALLRAAIAGPERRTSELPLLSATERDQILASGAAVAHWPVERCLHEIFAARAAHTPGVVAITGEGESLTYGELDTQANRLANRLRTAGVGPDVLVGLCCERTPRLLVGLLGILKAGGAYLPLDPDYPAERLAFMLEDAGVRALVTEEALLPRLPAEAGGGRTVLRLDADAEEIARESATAPESLAVPESLAYVIYTSGSTGRPKGSLVTHANVLRLFAATQPWLGFHEQDVWTLFHSYAFDFSVWEIWGALLYGGRLVVVPHAVSRSPEAYRELLVREAVTVLNQTPSAFRQLARADAEAADTEEELTLRLVIFGGEALEPASLAPWYARHPEDRPRLVNMYGITETTVHVTYRPLAAVDAEGGRHSPIGAPIPDLAAHLLDERLEPVPPGTAGELCVGGAGLARGYLNRPDLTAQRFVPDPYGEPGARLYRSGDLARRRQGGEIEYLGRIDHQVKIRGFRIELGEIEAEICRHPAIEQAVVVAVGRGEERRLIAYAVPTASGAAPEPAALREHLLARLPEHMVPAGWIFLLAIPLTAHDKVDRRALPSPERAAVATAAYEPPRSGLEQGIAAIWQEVLGLDKVGVHDNFFDLGGHSLLLVQVQVRLRERLGRPVSMIDLLSHATVSSLARLLSRGGEERADSVGADNENGRATVRTEDGKARLRQLRRGQRASVPNGGSYE